MEVLRTYSSTSFPTLSFKALKSWLIVARCVHSPCLYEFWTKNFGQVTTWKGDSWSKNGTFQVLSSKIPLIRKNWTYNIKSFSNQVPLTYNVSIYYPRLYLTDVTCCWITIHLRQPTNRMSSSRTLNNVAKRKGEHRYTQTGGLEETRMHSLRGLSEVVGTGSPQRRSFGLPLLLKSLCTCPDLRTLITRVTSYKHSV